MDIVIRSRLRETLREAGLNIKDLERKCGVSYVTLHGIASGKTKGIKYETLQSICAALGCQVTGVIEYVPDDPDSVVSAA